MKSLCASFLSIIFILSGSWARAQGSTNGGTVGQTTTTTSTVAPSTNINANANAGNSQATINMVGQIGIAGAMVAMSGWPPCTAPNGALMCAVAAAAGLQALAMNAGANNASQLAAATSSGLTGTTGSTAAGGTAAALKSLADTQSALKSAGVSVSPDGSSATLSDGSTIPTSALQSDAGLASLGLSPDAINAFKASVAQGLAAGQAAASKYSLATDGGGGGAGKATTDAGGDKGINFNKLMAGMNAKKRNPANVSGLSKKLGGSGDSIGLASDNIFEMVSRQYQRKDSQNTFLRTP
jgi:hypothetical protein